MGTEQRIKPGETRWDGTEVWQNGGWVCAICGNPTEDTYCEEHAPSEADMDNRVHQWKYLGKPEQGTLCGMRAFHPLFPNVRVLNMVPNPREITCGDCNYLMQKIEGGPICV